MDNASDWIDLELDYADWAHEAGADAVRIHIWPEGPGTVGVELLGAWSSPSAELVQRVQDRCTEMAPANLRVLVYVPDAAGLARACDNRCQDEFDFVWRLQT